MKIEEILDALNSQASAQEEKATLAMGDRLAAQLLLEPSPAVSAMDVLGTAMVYIALVERAKGIPLESIMLSLEASIFVGFESVLSRIHTHMHHSEGEVKLNPIAYTMAAAVIRGTCEGRQPEPLSHDELITFYNDVLSPRIAAHSEKISQDIDFLQAKPKEDATPH